MQSTVLIVTLAGMTSIAAVFWWVLAQASKSGDYPAVATQDQYRARLLIGLAAAGFVITALSLRQWPHAIAAGSANPVRVQATGSQWSWEVAPKVLPVGRPIVFSVSATDVTHGFGVYDSSGNMLFQTQAMPGYVNQIQYQFEKPGIYKVMCMEYCGLAHHDMMEELKVVSKAGE